MSRASDGPGALELVEEAVHALRRAPLWVPALYYLGSAPFVLALLFFWADMSRGALAADRCAAASLGLAVLFAWMKLCQAGFAAGLLRQRLAAGPVAWQLPEWRRAVPAQVLGHALGAVLLPIAVLLALPLGWVYAWCQNLTALGGSEDAGLQATVSRAWHQAMLWPGQNHLLMAVLSGFGAVVFINVVVAMAVLPGLLKSLLGIETALTSSLHALFNTTFLAVAVGLTYLCVDPLCKAVYVLRVFYGESLSSGLDLAAELQGLQQIGGRRGSGVVHRLVLGACLLLGVAGGGTEDVAASDPGPTQTLAAEELDRTIGATLQHSEFRWRLPRETTEEAEPAGLVATFLSGVWDLIADTLRWIGRGVRAFLNWLDSLFPDHWQAGKARDGSGMPALRSLLVLGLLLVVGILVIALMRHRRRAPEAVATAAEEVPARPNLNDETVAADQLPANEWMALARRLYDQGEGRLALRALYLASLAHLAHQDMVRIAPHKSNRDYRDELAARAHLAPELAAAFAANVGLFERVWYGLHEPTSGMTRQFSTNQKRILEFAR